ncbi:MAG: hypothetical protein WC061_06965, partial [Melioribacteraceae bacterium]
LVYSIIPYKTPWSMISFWSGIIIIAAYGITEAVTHSSKYFKTFLVIFAGLGILHQFWQSYQLSFTYSFHPQNPFVYSQAGGDMKLIEERIKQITGPVPGGDKTFICVAAAKNDYWPLPWYLRSFDNTGWVDKLPEEIYRYPIILTKPDLEEDLLTKLYSSPPPGERNLYIPLFDEYMELRPGIEIRGYIRKDYYDTYLRAKSE